MRRTDSGGLMSSVALVAGMALIGYIILSVMLGLPFAIPVGVIGAGATAIVLSGPLGKAMARRLEGGSPAAEETTGHLVEDMDELRQRLSELEERVYFSERLLAQQPKRGPLAAGSGS